MDADVLSPATMSSHQYRAALVLLYMVEFILLDVVLSTAERRTGHDAR